MLVMIAKGLDLREEYIQTMRIISATICKEEGCVLEVFNALGESLATIAVPISVLEALRSDEVLSVRPLAKAS